VGNDEASENAVRVAAGGPHRVVTFRGAADTREALAAGTKPWAAIVDEELDDGTELGVARLLRDSRSRPPVLVLTSVLSRALVNGAQVIGARLACKPSLEGSLRTFFDQLRQGERHSLAAFTAVADMLSLESAERDLVWCSLAGVPRDRLAEVMGVTEATVAELARSLVHKTGQETLDDVIWFVLLRVERTKS